MIHFSMLQLALIGALIAIALAAPLWCVKRICEGVPPAIRVPGRASGMGGFLLFIVFILICETVSALFNFGRGAGEVARVISMDNAYLMPALKTLLPDLVGSVLLIASLCALMFGRSPKALWSAVILSWVGGPVTAFLRQIYLGIPWELNSEPNGSLFLTVVMTLYLLLSTRSALTYGLPAGRALAARVASAEVYGRGS